MKPSYVKKTEKGVAVVSVLLLTVLSISLVTSLFWDQQVQVRSIENQRLQLQQQWILRGALDWAKLILLEDLKFSTTDDLTEPWNTPLMETRLDQFVKDSTIQTDAVEAILSGHVEDAQGKFNLISLASEGKTRKDSVETLQRIFKSIQVRSETALEMANLLADYQKNILQTTSLVQGNIGFDYLEDFLILPSFTKDTLERISKYVIILPRQTKTNINTASLQVIAAELDITYTDARKIKSLRDNAIFLDSADVISRAKNLGINVNVKNISVKTDFFIITGKVKLNKSLITRKCLFERNPEKINLIWLRDI